MTNSPATTSQIVGESPNHEGAPAGEPSPDARPEHPEDEQPEPERREDSADDVDLRPSSGRRVLNAPTEHEDRSDH